MRWRQFLTPVKSLNYEQCKTYLEGMPADEINILDVRQPNEYQNAHIPGAALIPLPMLGDRLKELDPQKPVIVYCAVGGRSRIAAQMLAGKGFNEVFNLTGGIRAWNGQTALGSEDMGLMLFSGHETVPQCLTIAYSLEEGLRDFYENMVDRVSHQEAKALFAKLADIEKKHQDRIYNEYVKLIDTPSDRKKFESDLVTRYAEGGLTSQEFGQLYSPNWESVLDIASMAMAIEAQALDLYMRAARKSRDEEVQKALNQIAAEETAHMNMLGQLIDTL